MFAQMGAVADEMATRTAALLNTPDIADASRILAMTQMGQVHRDLFAAVLARTYEHRCHRRARDRGLERMVGRGEFAQGWPTRP